MLSAIISNYLLTFFMQKKPIWLLRGNDFNQLGWHTRPTIGYQLMFEFLRLSPSYELARVARTTGLSKEQKKSLPKDFDQVLKLYDMLGDVQSILFRAWWLKRGLKTFGNPYSKPLVHKIALLGTGNDVVVDDVFDSLNRFLTDTRRDEGLAASMLVSIPAGGRKSDVLRQIRKLLDEQEAVQVENESSKPKLKLAGQRLHAKALFVGLRLMWFKAAKPKWENWRLGAKARVSVSYSPELDPSGPKKTVSAIEQDDRIIMGKITSRAVRRFENIIENAARGVFPSDKPVEASTFNYGEIAKRIQRKNRWEAAEKDRLSKLF